MEALRNPPYSIEWVTQSLHPPYQVPVSRELALHPDNLFVHDLYSHRGPPETAAVGDPHAPDGAVCRLSNLTSSRSLAIASFRA